MKKIILFALIALLPASLFAAEQTKIGVAAAVTGSVKAGEGKKTRIIKSGMPVYLNERIRTDASGTLQILLLDETVFKLGPGSDIVLDDFVYNPESSKGKISANITKGVFRFITGKIARKNPKDMNVKLAVGSIGIRGTIVAGTTGADGSTVILAGPGSKNNANEKAGAIFVSSGKKQGLSSGDELSGKSGSINGFYIDTPGNGTNIHSDGSMETPHPMGAELAAINSRLNAASDSSAGRSKTGKGKDGKSSAKNKNGNSGSASENNNGSKAADEGGSLAEQSGQSGAETSESAAKTHSGNRMIGSLTENSAKTVQEEKKKEDNPELVTPVSPYINGPEPYIPGRQYIFLAKNIPITAKGDEGVFSADFRTVADFTRKKINSTEIDFIKDGNKFSSLRQDETPVSMTPNPTNSSWNVALTGSMFSDGNGQIDESALRGDLAFTGSLFNTGIVATLANLWFRDSDNVIYTQDEEAALSFLMLQNDITEWLNSRSGTWSWNTYNISNISEGWNLENASLSLNFDSNKISGSYSFTDGSQQSVILPIDEQEITSNSLSQSYIQSNEGDLIFTGAVSMIFIQQNGAAAVRSDIAGLAGQEENLSATIIHTGLTQN